ncbi:MAG: hypothetical protein ACI4IG_07790 [Eubacterium sp.]
MIYTGKIKSIDQIIVSDPSYEKGIWCRYENDNVNAKDWIVDIFIQECNENVEGHNIRGIDLQMMLRDPSITARINDDSITYPKEFNINEFTIGMDTASVSIGTDKKAEEIRNERGSWNCNTALNTLTDGEFGCVFEGVSEKSGQVGFIYISGYLDDDTGYSFDDVLKYLTENLQIEGLTKNISKDETEIETFLVDKDGIDVSLATWFDVDKKFGTHVNDEDRHWVNLYALYNPSKDELTCQYSVDTPEKITHYPYTPTLYEKQMIKELINDYCLKEEQSSAKDLYESFMKSDEANQYFNFGDDNSINLEAIESALKDYSADIVLFHMTEEQRNLFADYFESSIDFAGALPPTLTSDDKQLYDAIIRDRIDECMGGIEQ